MGDRNFKDILRSVGGTPSKLGWKYISIAFQLAEKGEIDFLYGNKIYDSIAKICNVKFYNVERNIRSFRLSLDKEKCDLVGLIIDQSNYDFLSTLWYISDSYVRNRDVNDGIGNANKYIKDLESIKDIVGSDKIKAIEFAVSSINTLKEIRGV